jgi:2-methylcitrate dehydratase PrpD
MLELGKKIVLFADPTAVETRRFACQMKIYLNDGRVVAGSLTAPKGNYHNPLSGDELREKFLRLGGNALPREQLDEIVNRVATIETLGDVGPVVELMSLPAGD